MNKALFLDRDGVINIDHGYVYQKENFEFVEGIFDLCQIASNKGYLLIVITNQSGIGRGKYSTKQFFELSEWMKSEFLTNNIKITDVFYCPHHPSKAVDEYLKQCDCRKPEPGMILDAANKYNIDLKQSIFIGDKTSDMKAAASAGITRRILISSEYIDNQEISASRISSIKEASSYID